MIQTLEPALMSGEPVAARAAMSEPWTDNSGCVLCGEEPSPEGDDRCIRRLPGVAWACCGHGKTSAAYVVFSAVG